MFICLFSAFIVIWNFSYQRGLKEAYVPVVSPIEVTLSGSEERLFSRASQTMEYLQMPYDSVYGRDLKEYYANRAYPGAPPYIPHPVKIGERTSGRQCLQCHQNGGFVPDFKAYTPVTPHPEWTNCRQCHVSRIAEDRFDGSNFLAAETPPVPGKQALPGSPHQIPHDLQNRENCISCHGGPAAPREIRVTHPERINCRQCHVPTAEVAAMNGFIRQYTSP